MRSIVELDIAAPRDRVATLFADPEQSTKWMHDIARYEPVSGEFGRPGFTYRLVPKEGDMVFTATIVAFDLPSEARLTLTARNVRVDVTGRFRAIDPKNTRLTSEEIFTFEGMIGKLMGFFARGAIRTAHRRHMDAFKDLVESTAR